MHVAYFITDVHFGVLEILLVLLSSMESKWVFAAQITVRSVTTRPTIPRSLRVVRGCHFSLGLLSSKLPTD